MTSTGELHGRHPAGSPGTLSIREEIKDKLERYVVAILPQDLLLDVGEAGKRSVCASLLPPGLG